MVVLLRQEKKQSKVRRSAPGVGEVEGWGERGEITAGDDRFRPALCWLRSSSALILLLAGSRLMTPRLSGGPKSSAATRPKKSEGTEAEKS